MAATKVYVCDECGRQRGEANHWFVAMKDGGIRFYPWDYAESADYDPCQDWNGAVHLCGPGCAHKHLDRFLSVAIAVAVGGK